MVSQLEQVAEEVADSPKNSMHAGLEDVADSLKNSVHAGLAIHSIDAWICFS